MVSGSLILVATPIGNLRDLSPRAVEVLEAATVICCEDTRRTGLLLQYAGVAKTKLIRCDDHTEYDLSTHIVDLVARGETVAVVTDAGTPGISDPGQRLVAAVSEAGLAVSVVPGPAASIAALVVSGLPTDRYAFEGFLPRKAGERAEHLQSVASDRRTLVFYEAPHRLSATLVVMAAVFGSDRRAALVRELTKVHEEVLRGTLGDLLTHDPRGEYVIVVEGARPPVAATEDEIIEAMKDAMKRGMTHRDAAQFVSSTLDVNRRAAYDSVIRR